MLTVVITGGAGFIGTNIAKKFLDEGYHVIAFDNLQRRGITDNLKFLEAYPSPGKFTFVWGDVRNPEDFQEIPEHPNCLIHLGGQPGIPRSLSNPRYDFRANAEGTRNVLEYAVTHGKPVCLYASTNKVYSDKLNVLPLKELPLRYTPVDEGYAGNDESGPVDGCGSQYPHSPYGVSKLTGDFLFQEYGAAFGLPIVVNRMSCIGGLHQKGVTEQGWVEYFARRVVLEDGQLTIFGNGKQVRDVLDGRDVAELYFQEWKHIDQIAGSVFNVGGGMNNHVSLLETFQFFEQEFGKKATLTFAPERLADHRYYISDVRKVTSALPWKPTISWQQTMKDIVLFESGVKTC